MRPLQTKIKKNLLRQRNETPREPLAVSIWENQFPCRKTDDIPCFAKCFLLGIIHYIS